MMTPENVYPVSEYLAEYEDDKDDSMKALCVELDEIKDLEDIRPILEGKFKIREILKNSKLI